MAARKIALAATVALALTATPALAAWNATGSGTASAKASSILAVDKPVTTRAGRTLTTTFPQTTVNGTLLTTAGGSYAVARTGTSSAACTATVNAAGGTCTQTLTPGTYTYAVTPNLSLWTRAAVAADAVTIPPPSLILSSPGFDEGNDQYTFTGTLDGFADGQALSYYRLDSASSATPAVTGDLAAIPTPQTTTPPTTLVRTACSSTAGAPHTINVPSDLGNVAGTLNYDFTSVLCPTNVVSTGGTLGTAAAGDRIAITMNQAVDADSICTGLSASGAAFTQNYLTVTLTDGGGATNDTLTVTAPLPPAGFLDLVNVTGACGAMRYGALGGGGTNTAGNIDVGAFDLGSPNYVSGAAITFGGTGNARSALVLSPSNTLTITLGTASATPTVTAASATPKYTSDSGITAGSKTAKGVFTGSTRLL